ncbi:ABC transporter permease, partial [bacterium]|nr:ABC transporter permease [bacterium]
MPSFSYSSAVNTASSLRGLNAPQAPKTRKNRMWMSKSRRTIGIWLALPFVLYIATFFIIPLLSVCYMSTEAVSDMDELVPAYTLANYASALSPQYLPILLRSALYAGITTMLCLGIGYPLAWFIARHGGKHKTIYLLLVMLPFWTSYLIRIFAWMTILQTEGVLNSVLLHLGLISAPFDILNSPISVILGLTYGFLPFATLPLYATLEKLDFGLLEAAADLGSTPRKAFFHVILPLSIPGITAACLLTFVPAM